MNRAALEHILRAAAAVADEHEFVVIGSQAIPIPIHNENTGGATGWCLEVHDLAVSKLVAGRDKDVAFLRVLLRERMASAGVLRERLSRLAVPGNLMEFLRQRLDRAERAAARGE
jgi:hypothetical protein